MRGIVTTAHYGKMTKAVIGVLRETGAAPTPGSGSQRKQILKSHPQEKTGADCYALVPVSYQPLLAFTTRTTASITGTSINTPTTVASAAPDSNP
jgi:hypothetical protein